MKEKFNFDHSKILVFFEKGKSIIYSPGTQIFICIYKVSYLTESDYHGPLVLKRISTILVINLEAMDNKNVIQHSLLPLATAQHVQHV